MASANTSTGTSRASLRLALRRSRRLRWVLAGIATVVVGFVVFAVVLLRPDSSTSPNQRFAQAAVRYANTQIVWNRGPSVTSTRVLPLDGLSAALKKTVPRHVAQDVNIADLIHRFGARREIALVVLTGDFNSLPPDEGVVFNGQIVVLVDVRQNRAFYLMD